VRRKFVDEVRKSAAADDSDLPFGERTHDLLKSRASAFILLDRQDPHRALTIVLERVGEPGGDQGRTRVPLLVAPLSGKSIHEPELAAELPELRGPCTHVLMENEVLQQSVVVELFEVAVSGSAH
jgi:hypothetical protein